MQCNLCWHSGITLACWSSTSTTENTPSVHVLVSIQAPGRAYPWGPGRIHHQLHSFCMYLCYISSQKVRPTHCLPFFSSCSPKYKGPFLCLPSSLNPINLSCKFCRMIQLSLLVDVLSAAIGGWQNSTVPNLKLNIAFSN